MGKKNAFNVLSFRHCKINIHCCASVFSPKYFIFHYYFHYFLCHTNFKDPYYFVSQFLEPFYFSDCCTPESTELLMDLRHEFSSNSIALQKSGQFFGVRWFLNKHKFTYPAFFVVRLFPRHNNVFSCLRVSAWEFPYELVYLLLCRPLMDY